MQAAIIVRYSRIRDGSWEMMATMQGAKLGGWVAVWTRYCAQQQCWGQRVTEAKVTPRFLSCGNNGVSGKVGRRGETSVEAEMRLVLNVVRGQNLTSILD